MLGLAGLDDLTELVDDFPLDEDGPPPGRIAVAQGRDPGADVQRIADLDRALELPLDADEHLPSARGPAALEETLLDGEHEQSVGDALPEERGLHVLGVGVQDVVIAGEPGKDHDVRFGHRPAGRIVLLPDAKVLEREAGLSVHEAVG